MSKQKYTIAQIELLNRNSNVVRVRYGRQIEYKEYFKKWAVVQSIKYSELSANQIFELAGFDINIIGKRTADSRIRCWKNNYYQFQVKTPNIKKEESEDKNYKLLVMLCNKFDSLLTLLLRNGNR